MKNSKNKQAQYALTPILIQCRSSAAAYHGSHRDSFLSSKNILSPNAGLTVVPAAQRKQRNIYCSARRSVLGAVIEINHKIAWWATLAKSQIFKRILPNFRSKVCTSKEFFEHLASVKLVVWRITYIHNTRVSRLIERFPQKCVDFGYQLSTKSRRTFSIYQPYVLLHSWSHATSYRMNCATLTRITAMICSALTAAHTDEILIPYTILFFLLASFF